ncbi:hypothetical protein DSO57_1015914 [Entomophthora muscae]|uniref:Uncharacterized protein n=1 Tax=Entomophthora muscae TaxID=34485 RepID=A0ACC2TS40_9FUNG|nr:hypothetical protein DSO57_1015914 [Entomophthora muscae]
MEWQGSLHMIVLRILLWGSCFGKQLSLKDLDKKYGQCYGINIRELSIERVHRLYSEERLNPAGLVECYLARIKVLDPSLNSVLEINPDAMEEAKRLRWDDSCLPLYGIPILVKDNFATLNTMSTASGSLALLHQYPTSEATVIKLLKRAGAVILGKSNMSEFAGLLSINATRGWSTRGNQTNNVYVLSRSPGGSSSGSAVAVSANLCMVAIGTETDGSIIGPAALNGIVGMKAAVGAIPTDGIIPLAPSQDAVGILARSVEDAFTVYACLDPKELPNIASLRNRHEYFAKRWSPPPSKARVGIVSNEDYLDEIPEASQAIRKFIKRANVNLQWNISMNIKHINQDDGNHPSNSSNI